MLLKNEISFGRRCLSSAADLRDECLRLRDNARDRRKNEEEERKRDREKEERKKLKELSTPDVPLTTGGLLKKKNKKLTKTTTVSNEALDATGDTEDLSLDEDKKAKVKLLYHLFASDP